MVIQRLRTRIELGFRGTTKLVKCVVTFSPSIILALALDRCTLLVLGEFQSLYSSNLCQINR